MIWCSGAGIAIDCCWCGARSWGSFRGVSDRGLARYVGTCASCCVLFNQFCHFFLFVEFYYLDGFVYWVIWPEDQIHYLCGMRLWQLGKARWNQKIEGCPIEDWNNERFLGSFDTFLLTIVSLAFETVHNLARHEVKWSEVKEFYVPLFSLTYLWFSLIPFITLR